MGDFSFYCPDMANSGMFLLERGTQAPVFLIKLNNADRISKGKLDRA